MKVLLLFILAYSFSANAQDSTIIVKAGMSINESVSKTDMYEYPQFVYGKVFFKPGDSSTGRLNYNKLVDQMQFIDFKGDTLNIADPATIKSISINRDLFYYDNGYVKLIEESNTIKLATKQTLRFVGKEKTGAYNTASSTTAINTYSSFISDGKEYKVVPGENLILKKQTQYYFGDKYNHFTLANKKNMPRLFPKQNAALTAYLKENDVDFTNREDLEKLLQYLASL
jgi:hypothetical protein